MDASEIPTTNPRVVVIVVLSLALIALTGFVGTIWLCRINTDPTLVATAAKMIQTDPSSAMAALMLLRPESAVIAIVSNLTGVALGLLGSILSSSRTQRTNGEPKIIKTETTTTSTSSTPSTSTTTATPGEVIVPEQTLETKTI